MLQYRIAEPRPGFVSRNVNDIVTISIDEVLTKVRKTFSTKVMVDWPVDMGTSKMQINDWQALALVHFVECGAPWGIVIEFGRRAGQPGPHSDMLKGWARRVLGDEDAAYPVARKIHEKGTEGKFIFKKVSEDLFPQVPGMLEAKGKEIGQKLA